MASAAHKLIKPHVLKIVTGIGLISTEVLDEFESEELQRNTLMEWANRHDCEQKEFAFARAWCFISPV